AFCVASCTVNLLLCVGRGHLPYRTICRESGRSWGGVLEPAAHRRADGRRRPLQIALQPQQVVDGVDVVGAAREARLDADALRRAQRVGQDALGPPLDIVE